MSRWPFEYSPRFNKKIVNLNNPIAAHRIRRLCEWIAEQKDPDRISHIQTCEEKINKKLFFNTYGFHIVYRFVDQNIIFLMFYNDSENNTPATTR